MWVEFFPLNVCKNIKLEGNGQSEGRDEVRLEEGRVVSPEGVEGGIIRLDGVKGRKVI